MPQFAATIRHITDGLTNFTISQATRNIEGWEATLKDTDVPGAKAIVTDLGRLKKQLHAEPFDGDAVMQLVGKLGKETVAISKKADGEKAEKIQMLGQALSDAAGSK